MRIMRPHPSRTVTAEAGPPSQQPGGPPAGSPPRPPRRRRLAVALLAAGITAAAAAAVVSEVVSEVVAGGMSGERAEVPGGLLASSGGSASGSLTHADAEAEPREPTPEQRARFLARIGAIAPWLASEEVRTLNRARATCDDIQRGDPDDQLVSDAQERFTDVTAGQAAEIVEAVRSWCAP